MVGEGHLAGQSKFIGRNYLTFVIGGTTVYINYYEKLNRSLPKCIESCGTVDRSSSIVKLPALAPCQHSMRTNSLQRKLS